MVEDALFAEEAVAAEGETVVGGVDDDGALGEATGFERGEDAADLGVEVLDHRVVFGELVADHLLGARPRAEVFVAASVHRAVVEGELREEIFRERRAGGVVGGETGRGLARVVGGGEGDVTEERFRVGLGRLFFEEADRGVGEHRSGETGAHAGPTIFPSAVRS